MELIVVFVVLSLHTSWQQESTETINETLDRLIKQTNVEHYENNITELHTTKNNSKMFYLQPSQSNTNIEKDETLAKATSINTRSGGSINIIDILRALGLDVSKTANNNVNEMKLMKPFATKPDAGDSKQEYSRSGRPAALNNIAANDIMTMSSELENNFLHNYPELIIDRITYHNLDDDETQKRIETKSSEQQMVSQVTESQNSNTLSFEEELKSLLEEVQKLKAETGNTMQVQKTDQIAVPKFLRAPQKPCSLCNNAINKMPEYQTNTRHEDSNLQLSRWAQNSRQNVLTNIRAEKMKRMYFLTDLINNMMPRFVYRPLYG